MAAKLLFMHDFGVFPRSVDNAATDSDYYAVNYLKAAGMSGAYTAEGGYLRNRPMGRPVLGTNWRDLDAQNDITNAKNAGIDGFMCDVLGFSGNADSTWGRYMAHIAAASFLYPDGSFKVVPMLDGNGYTVQSGTQDQISDAIYAFSQNASSWYLADGRYVVSSFAPETKTAAWWDGVFTNCLTRHGLHIAFMPAYLNISAATSFTGYAWTYGTGYWGDGSDPNITINAGDKVTAIHGRGEVYFPPVQGQNVRPDQHLYDEAYGTWAFRAAWERNIADGADFMQMVTMNDYSEGGEMAWSFANSSVWLDLVGWYSTKWKTGSYPTILKDAIILSHRNQLSTATPTGGATAPMAQWNRVNKSAVQNQVEILTFLTHTADVQVTIGGATTTYTALPGMYVKYLPLLTGAAPTAKIVRNGIVSLQHTSPVAVLSSPVKQDMQYFRSSSARGTAGQFDPQVKYGY